MERKVESGIYTITAPSGSQYVGSAVCFASRRRQHFHLLRTGKHHNPGLQRAVTKYGIESLKFEPMLVCRKEDLIFFEQRAIDVLKPRYNACPTAGSQLGRRHTSESKEKNAVAHRGRPIHSDAYLASLSRRMKGNRYGVGNSPSPETRAKLSMASKGEKRVFTSTERQEISSLYQSGAGLLDISTLKRADHRTIRRALLMEGVKIRARGENGPVSNETRAKLSAAALGSRRTDETRKKMSEAAFRRESRKRVRAAIALQDGS